MKIKELRELEKRAYLSWHRDGLADIGLGILVLLFGLGMKYDQTLLAPIYGCLGYPIWLILKQRITEKRLGYVEFGEERKTREKRGWILLFLLGCVFLMLGIMAYILVSTGRGGTSLPGGNGLLFLGVVFAVLISSIGIVLQLVRLHAYSVFVVFSVLLGHFLGWLPESAVILGGAVPTTSGFILLVTFLKKYPVVKSTELPEVEDRGDSVQ